MRRLPLAQEAELKAKGKAGKGKVKKKDKASEVPEKEKEKEGRKKEREEEASSSALLDGLSDSELDSDLALASLLGAGSRLEDDLVGLLGPAAGKPGFAAGFNRPGGSVRDKDKDMGAFTEHEKFEQDQSWAGRIDSDWGFKDGKYLDEAGLWLDYIKAGLRLDKDGSLPQK